VQLEEICSRLNKIIERSNGIDRRLSQIEEKGKKGHQERARTEVSSSRPSRRPPSAPPADVPSRSLVLEELSQTHESNTFSEVPRPAPRAKTLTLSDLYGLILDLKEEVSQVVETQREIKLEIQKLKNVRKSY
jgi:hypothetical protein